MGSDSEGLTMEPPGTACGDTGPKDPWKHRSDGMKCKTCMWFVPKIASKDPRGDGPFDHPTHDVGRCRRHAPTMNGYPVVFVNDWCGDHKLDENKV